MNHLTCNCHVERPLWRRSNGLPIWGRQHQFAKGLRSAKSRRTGKSRKAVVRQSFPPKVPSALHWQQCESEPDNAGDELGFSCRLNRQKSVHEIARAVSGGPRKNFEHVSQNAFDRFLEPGKSQDGRAKPWPVLISFSPNPSRSPI